MMSLFFTPKSENERYTRQIRNSAGIAVFVSERDDKAHWVQAGRCYERFALQANGGATITERGVVYAATATNADPLIGGVGVTKLVGSGTTGVFTVGGTGLTTDTGYSFKAYATNSVGTKHSTPVSTFTTLSTNANLSNLVLTTATLSPAFASGTTSYTASVPNSTTSVTVTPTLAQANATVTVNTVSVASGTPSGAISLSVGTNVITTIVTAQDGLTTKAYTVTVTRLAPPTVTTRSSAGITAVSATLGGNVTSDGGATISERGVVYAATATNADPLISGAGVTKVIGAGTTGVFTANAAGFTAGTGYSFKAYAINSEGTTYTTPVTAFTTLALAPTVVAPASASITATSATLGGNVTSDGGATVTERGVVYAATTTDADPLISGAGVTKLAGSGSTGVFTLNATGLTADTGYSFKAYAINSVGTSYTPVSSFTTSSSSH
ncbi:MAG: cadherin-like beta sandwich domain-containing protein [Betaproteobacteria bacterium]